MTSGIRRKSIVTRIILIFCLIISISLIVMGIISYRYNYQILKNQCLENEVYTLNSTADQMEYITDDIQKYAVGIALDSEIQKYLKKDYKDYYDRVIATDEMENKLNTISVQREYVYNLALVKGGDIVLSKQQYNIGLDVQAFRLMLKEPWYSNDYSNGWISYFSVPYTLENVKIIPYIFKVVDLYHPQTQLGKLVVNLNYASIEKYMINSGQESDNFFWSTRETP